MTPLPASDLAQIVRATSSLWAPLCGGRILLTGTTGFFGCWLLESLVAINRELGLGIVIFAQSRDPARFLARMPHLGAEACIHWLVAEPSQLMASQIRSKVAGSGAGLDAIIHLVTEADNADSRARPAAAAEAIVGSTKQALRLAREMGARYFLFASSGSVYARLSGAPHKISEMHPLTSVLSDPALGYAFSGGLKRQAEELCGACGQKHGLNVTIARGFTFVGPHLPRQSKFALGNFLDDALQGRDIVIRGDGTPIRSYLYAADLTVWLCTILLRGVSGRTYNVGSEQAITLRDMAEVVRREVAPAVNVTVMGQASSTSPADYYVPDTRRARQELALVERVPLDEAIRRTIEWTRQP